MPQIKYGDSSFALRLEMPDHWDVETISAVAIEITNRGASELLASTGATLYSATTLGAAASAGDAYVELAAESASPSPGDRMVIAASDDGDREIITVNHYDDDNLYLYPERELRHAHTSGAAVVGAYATYALDASDTDVFSKALLVRVVWTPDSDDISVTDEYDVAGISMAGGPLWSSLEATYPAIYEMIGTRDPQQLEEGIRTRFSTAFLSRGMDTTKIVQQSILDSGLLLFARYAILDGSPIDEEQFQRAKTAWVEWFQQIAAMPIWQDLDQDGSEDSNEVQDHEWEILRQDI